MAKLKVTDWINRLKYCCNNRITYYDNTFPSNCGEINPDGSISFDCIGLVKSVINEPDIVYKTSPAGYYVKPGQVIPDTTEIGILQLCTDQVWGDFSNAAPGEYLYMGGHGGVYVGNYTDSSGTVNTIECTGAMGGGVRSSYCDAKGNRYDHKGGNWLGKWEAHGKLSKYIDYSAKSEPAPTPAPTPAKKSVDEIAKEVIAGKWDNYPRRKHLLEAAGYSYNEVQKRVNEMVKDGAVPKKKSVDEVAREVIEGKWDVYPRRKQLLEAAGYNYNEVQGRVDQLLS